MFHEARGVGSNFAPKCLSHILKFSLTATEIELFHDKFLPISCRVGLLSSCYGMNRRRLLEAPHNFLAREQVLHREATRLVLISDSEEARVRVPVAVVATEAVSQAGPLDGCPHPEEEQSRPRRGHVPESSLAAVAEIVAT